MRLRSLTLAALAGVLALGAASPAFADWDRYNRNGWRQQEWRHQAWRERQWREHVWRERQRERFYNPPVIVAPPYGYYGYRY